MRIAQQLYEGVELGDEGSVGLITYMRTDSTRISGDAIAAARGYIAERYGAPYVPEQPNVYRSKKDAQDAHEAIRPTSLEWDPGARRTLPRAGTSWQLYTLIWNRFVASQMAPAVYDATAVDIEAGTCRFRATGQVMKFDGFIRVYTEGVDDQQPADRTTTRSARGSFRRSPRARRCACSSCSPEQHFTQPPPRFSEATLVKELEENGIGRPSTYASIMATILNKEYVTEDEQRRLKPTELGFLVTDLLVESFPDILNVEFTAGMEDELDRIEEGQEPWVQALRRFWEPFSKDLEKADVQMRDVKREERPTGIPCEKCGKPMVIKWGRRGEFLACSGYPDCKNTKNFTRDEDGTIRPAEPEVTDEICEKCGKPMQVRFGRFGKFLGCSGYPECTNVQPMHKPKPTGITCAGCGQGEMMERLSRRGKVFYSCNRYPDCTFVAWDPPVADAMPQVRRHVRHREGHQALRHGPALREGGLRLAGAAPGRGRRDVRAAARAPRGCPGPPPSAREGRGRRRRCGGADEDQGEGRPPADDQGHGREAGGAARRPGGTAPDPARRAHRSRLARMTERVTVIGGGLAGAEAAWHLARAGVPVDLFEMRPVRGTAAHQGDRLGELVCSNSFRNATLETAVGLLKDEMRLLGSLVMQVADAHRVPAGACLAVDRTRFAEALTRAVESEPLIRLVREEVTALPAGLTILATGPLTSPALSARVAGGAGRDPPLLLRRHRADGGQRLDRHVDRLAGVALRQGRRGLRQLPARPRAVLRLRRRGARGREGARRASSSAASTSRAACPIEEMARRGRDTLAFGPMRPVGLDRSAHRRARLRRACSCGRTTPRVALYNMVGFQTKMTYPEQRRVFRMIPGLAAAEFVRLGSLHRNTYVDAPTLLLPSLQVMRRRQLLLAGQIVGVEGYVESAATGILAGLNVARLLRGEPTLVPPRTTALGSLLAYVTHRGRKEFQPMNANYGLFPPLARALRGREKKLALAERALEDLVRWRERVGLAAAPVARQLA